MYTSVILMHHPLYIWISNTVLFFCYKDAWNGKLNWTYQIIIFCRDIV
jgi:hypothetical protein